ncbi:acetyl-coenzyme A synthetase [Rhodococcus aetherivorans]|uniref:Acetyl-coenzyme A synthetase n=1 Tax=Rhodococcus aetherivorans TaxID=191292 RepID=A0A059MVE8_9NOCA|nr:MULTISPECIES: propionyl-CoA synthetase [Rhodococcus]ETT28095.1 Acetate--CoA ligase [Rhodococcus rhodochrous ATCC 21198]ANZ26405.1 propionyl-CoA synthetase [Rhodococcus sp. WB1]KDE15113.1 propionyl-CoA synthetase [Rhodococcus aetherivorans]MDV6294447.1 propionyl-CoA synthetase [Rhodococcus aetherivorans]NGP27667.1 propionyl-CoA synthetase [Rhodococcus aetherivorans]
MSSYAEAFRQSVEDPEGFWLEAARAVDWVNTPTRALDGSQAPSFRWFPDGTLNTSFNALDRHVQAGHGDRPALIWDSAMVPAKRTYTYAELLDEVAAFAGVLRDQGVVAGDRVVIYMPMIPEAAIAMLACARIGAVHSVVFGGFAAKELATRIDDARPVLLVTASGGLEPGRTVEYLPMVEQALSLSQTPPHTVIVKNREMIPGSAADYKASVATWFDWDELTADADPAGPVTVAATDPLYILYTSGTTGKPKGVVRDNGGHAVALTWSMRNIYDISPGDVWWTASDVGWVVGHSYIVYGPLLIGATTVMYEGKPVGTPDAGAFWRIINENSVVALFTAPTAIRAVRKADPEAKELENYDISSLRTLFAAGERLDPDTYEWATKVLDRPVVDHWWQTETGWAIAANLRGLDPMPIKAGSPTVPVPGYRVDIVDAEGKPVEAGTEGNIVIALPLPPGTLTGLWQDEDRYRRSYLETFPGYYLTGDSGYVDEDGYVFVLGRSDDVINVAGHRLSTGSMEAVVASHPAVAECAVVGIRDELKGQRPSGYVVLKSGVEIDPETLRQELVAMVREQIGAVATFRDVTVVQALPKTRSGKILRKTMRQIADHEQYTVPSTIEDPSVLEALEQQLRG